MNINKGPKAQTETLNEPHTAEMRLRRAARILAQGAMRDALLAKAAPPALETLAPPLLPARN